MQLFSQRSVKQVLSPERVTLGISPGCRPWFCKEVLSMRTWGGTESSTTFRFQKTSKKQSWLLFSLKLNKKTVQIWYPTWPSHYRLLSVKPLIPAHACNDLLRKAHVKWYMYVQHVSKKIPKPVGLTASSILFSVYSCSRQISICCHAAPTSAPPGLCVSSVHFAAVYSPSKSLCTCHLHLFEQERLESWSSQAQRYTPLNTEIAIQLGKKLSWF